MTKAERDRLNAISGGFRESGKGMYEPALKRLFVAKLFVVKNFSILINIELTVVKKFYPP